MMRFTIVALGYIGTVAMLLVAGAIFVHNIPFIHEFFHNNLSFHGVLYLLTITAEMGIGFVVGLVAFVVSKLISKRA